LFARPELVMIITFVGYMVVSREYEDLKLFIFSLDLCSNLIFLCSDYLPFFISTNSMLVSFKILEEVWRLVFYSLDEQSLHGSECIICCLQVSSLNQQRNMFFSLVFGGLKVHPMTIGSSFSCSSTSFLVHEQLCSTCCSFNLFIRQYNSRGN